MAKRPRPCPYAVSEWELDEIQRELDAGYSSEVIAFWHGITRRTITRWISQGYLRRAVVA